MATLNEEQIEVLVQTEDIVRCAACGELSAQSWDHVTEKEVYYLHDFQPGEIANIGASSCFEWECGHCGANNVNADAPILAEVYTHQEYTA